MLSYATEFVKKRRRALTVVASVVGGAYLVASYARQRFKDLSERLVLDRTAKENLRRRFQQNQEDCGFTILALLPTLSKQVLEEIDVEALTAELQRRAEQSKKDGSLASGGGTPALTNSTPSLDSSSIIKVNGDATPNGEHHATSEDSALSKDDTATQQTAHGEATQTSQEPLQESGHLDTSVLEQEGSTDSRTKAELWQAIKLGSFHRTVTSIYLICLLALQTHIQLNLLGRHNYVSSIYEEAEEAAFQSRSSSPTGLFDELDGDIALGELASSRDGIDPVSERQYLTFSWWLLQRGWKQISARVEESAREALASMSLKTQLSAQDLSKLLLDIRRRVEYEATGACHSFASALFPATHAEELETLYESGLVSSDESDARITPSLRRLLDETQDFAESSDFSVVLRSCLDKCFLMLTSSLEHLFLENGQIPPSKQIQEIAERKVKLAAVLPALARSSHTILNGVPNEYAETLADIRELQEFSAVVFSNFVLEA